jgi:hypothetical protein
MPPGSVAGALHSLFQTTDTSFRAATGEASPSASCFETILLISPPDDLAFREDG